MAPFSSKKPVTPTTALSFISVERGRRILEIDFAARERALQPARQRVDVHLQSDTERHLGRNTRAHTAVGGAGDGLVQADAVAPERLIAEGRKTKGLASFAHLFECVKLRGEIPGKIPGTIRRSRDCGEQGGSGRSKDSRFHGAHPLSICLAPANKMRTRPEMFRSH